MRRNRPTKTHRLKVLRRNLGLPAAHLLMARWPAPAWGPWGYSRRRVLRRVEQNMNRRVL